MFPGGTFPVGKNTQADRPLGDSVVRMWWNTDCWEVNDDLCCFVSCGCDLLFCFFVGLLRSCSLKRKNTIVGQSFDRNDSSRLLFYSFYFWLENDSVKSLWCKSWGWNLLHVGSEKNFINEMFWTTKYETKQDLTVFFNGSNITPIILPARLCARIYLRQGEVGRKF